MYRANPQMQQMMGNSLIGGQYQQYAPLIELLASRMNRFGDQKPSTFGIDQMRLGRFNSGMTMPSEQPYYPTGSITPDPRSLPPSGPQNLGFGRR